MATDRKRNREEEEVKAKKAIDTCIISHEDNADTYTPHQTHQCALQRKCVPCAYKLGRFDVALDKEFTRLVPNRRPETCPRACIVTAQGETLGFQRGMSALTVGDGDFTFSLAMARFLLGSNESDDTPSSHRGILVASSYESRETLRRVYPNIQETIDELESLGVTICYQVDATKLVETLPKAACTKFHRICWNFPCSAISSGQDGQNNEMEFNKQLVRDFVRNATTDLLEETDGEIHMLHKTKPPFNQWHIEAVALEGLSGNRVLEYKGRVVFDRCMLPPYVPRKALDRKSFPCHDARTYVFGWAAEDSLVGKKHTFESTIPPVASNSSDSQATEDEGKKRERLQPVTKQMLMKIRQLHLATAAGATVLSGDRRDKKKKR